ncbi:alpha/beta hydrolase [Sphingomonas sp. SUN019]|uniref:alpha/beta hydrolase n=1 Tax=Sphingomonas sp. SUN019 TaxID=2937788 RepID=UPI002164C507|nr:alpha/beta hydrolase [Sphingomonas sp. SUN019]UVO52260.1 alpha/beta hydrolase [Sphingomonas sp. SUN019]
MVSHAAHLSIVTLGDRGVSLPAWETMFAWPRFGDAHVDLSADTVAQRNQWAAKLDTAVAHADRAVLLVANGASCFATAWWARLTPKDYVSRVAGALLFVPSDDRDGETAARFASPRIALPFPSLVVSHDMGAGDADRLRLLAANWGSRVIESSRERRFPGAGAWRQAQRMIESVTARVVDHDVARMERLVFGRPD